MAFMQGYGGARGSYARGDVKGLATFMAGVSLYTIHLANLLIAIDRMNSSICTSSNYSYSFLFTLIQ